MQVNTRNPQTKNDNVHKLNLAELAPFHFFYRGTMCFFSFKTKLWGLCQTIRKENNHKNQMRGGQNDSEMIKIIIKRQSSGWDRKAFQLSILDRLYILMMRQKKKKVERGTPFLFQLHSHLQNETSKLLPGVLSEYICFIVSQL